MWNCRYLKRKGKENFKKNYVSCVIVSFILAFLLAASTGIAGRETNSLYQFQQEDELISSASMAMLWATLIVVVVVVLCIEIFIRNMLIVGGYRFYIRNSQRSTTSWKVIFSMYTDGRFMNIFETMFLTGLYQLLWTCLFIIPGIVKYYSYRMVPYILADTPSMEPDKVIRKSRKMMKGQKWNAFVLDLSFIGWEIVSACTLGILGIFYVNPYKDAANAELYKVLKNNMTHK